MPGRERNFCRQAIDIAPNLAEAHNNLGVSLRGQGKYKEAETCYQKVVELDPSHTTGHSNLIFALDFNSNYSVKDHQEERARWQKLHTVALTANIKPNKNDPDPDRKLRIGYVSADFRRHSAANCFGPMLLSFDHTQFASYCYSSNLQQDEMTETFRSAATVWRECRRLSDAQLAEKIRDDKIDILIDLSGHSAGNRMLAFARKPAPVQVTAWGHGCGTGLTAIDYFLTDPIIVPEPEKVLYAETIRYLPSHIHYMPPQAAPDIVDAPHLENGFITYGSFNRLEKISDESLKLWSRILGETDDAHLVIKSQTLGRLGVKKDLECRLQDAALPTDRITLLGSDPQPQHLATHSLVDIMLDPFPHGGGISTSDALWMGVPVITLAGNTIPGRLTASTLNAIGLPELVANSQDQYVEIASQLGRDSALIVTLRHSMRDRVEHSPVGNSKKYVRAVETLYREFWKQWCANQ
ncbi:MAG: tetratricopeptide repeat protein [Candidatus Latescibacterota bacterium]